MSKNCPFTWPHLRATCMAVFALAGAPPASAQPAAADARQAVLASVNPGPKAKPSAPGALVCHRAKVEASPNCGKKISGTDPGANPGPNSCGDGVGGDPMAQLQGNPLPNVVTGRAQAYAYDGVPPRRRVSLQYRVPDVRVFAPEPALSGLVPIRTTTWIIKSPTTPGKEAHRQRITRSGRDFSTAWSGTSDTQGTASHTDPNWLLVGRVEARQSQNQIPNQLQPNLSYGFVCKLPVKDLILQNGP